jgi:hypothetical protein
MSASHPHLAATINGATTDDPPTLSAGCQFQLKRIGCAFDLEALLPCTIKQFEGAAASACLRYLQFCSFTCQLFAHSALSLSLRSSISTFFAPSVSITSGLVLPDGA